jgi:hypothetical protein
MVRSTTLESSACPTCGQDLGSDRRAELGATLGGLQAELNRIDDDTGDLQAVSAQIAGLNNIRGVNLIRHQRFNRTA